MKKPARTRSAEEEIIEITDSEEEKSIRNATEVQPESQRSEGFGKPLDCLLQGVPQSPGTSRHMEETQESNYVPITPDSAAPLEPLLLQHADSSFSEGDSEGYESSIIHVAVGGDGEWGMGDDERATRMEVDVDEVEEPEEEPDDEDRVVLPHELQESGGDERFTCPLCGRDLSLFDEEVRSQNLTGHRI